ncbi:alpha/beta hydrolase family protein [Nocardia sp. NBC_01329]|uniref:alpha/beta hydrolase family protein n=1 Tax=Nocardia sp. NBC_01329 TaxID=2903594 RepID=UPI002E0F418F|nr:alpha/beta hydrolase [Nocardia sp. NBC_01329]
MRIETNSGPAEAEIDYPDTPAFLLVFTHGAGGGVDSADILTVRDTALAAGGVVARVLQPYRVAGRRAPGKPEPQDRAWVEVVAALRSRTGPELPLVQGGRSNGARVACRTATELGARGVVALSFPLHPPGKPEKSRRDELLAAGDAEVVVINGGSDPFGIPDAGDAAEVRVIAGQPHAFRKGFDTIAETLAPWFRQWSSR